jgi:hypothetical protein
VTHHSSRSCEDPGSHDLSPWLSSGPVMVEMSEIEGKCDEAFTAALTALQTSSSLLSVVGDQRTIRMTHSGTHRLGAGRASRESSARRRRELGEEVRA